MGKPYREFWVSSPETKNQKKFSHLKIMGRENNFAAQLRVRNGGGGPIVELTIPIPGEKAHIQDELMNDLMECVAAFMKEKDLLPRE